MVNQYCAHSFARNWQLPFLHQQKIFHDHSPQKMFPTLQGSNPQAPDLQSGAHPTVPPRLAGVAILSSGMYHRKKYRQCECQGTRTPMTRSTCSGTSVQVTTKILKSLCIVYDTCCSDITALHKMSFSIKHYCISYFSKKTNDVGTHQKCLPKALLMSTHTFMEK